ncbi:MAG: TMEM165/GDT1 family protein [Actinobacteria bacterium]|nr:TMEM165/GDT1 family protein [Actinomycetota bacterium]
MWWQALLASFGLMFVAELGDKSQIVILTLAARHGFKSVFLGAACAFALLNALAVSVGVLVYELVPETALKYTVSAIFIIFGILALLPRKEKTEEEEERRLKGRHGPLITAFLLVCLLELGDKTQLSLVAITAKYSQPVFVFIGGTLALWATSLIGAAVGMWLGKSIPQVWIHRASGVIFIAFGIINLFW